MISLPNHSINLEILQKIFMLIPSFVIVSHFLEHPWIQNAKKAPNVPLGDVVKSRLKQFSVMNRFKRKALRVCLSDKLSLLIICMSHLLNQSYLANLIQTRLLPNFYLPKK